MKETVSSVEQQLSYVNCRHDSLELDDSDAISSPESAALCSHPDFLVWLLCYLQLGLFLDIQPSFQYLELFHVNFTGFAYLRDQESVPGRIFHGCSFAECAMAGSFSAASSFLSSMSNPKWLSEALPTATQTKGTLFHSYHDFHLSLFYSQHLSGCEITLLIYFVFFLFYSP